MSRLDRCSDAELLANRSEPSAAFEVFYDRHAQAILSYLSRRTGSTDVALELTSEVFAEALAGRRRYRAEEGSARGWLFGIANNKLAASRKRQAIERAGRRRLSVAPIEFTDVDIERAEELIDASEEGYLRGLEGLSEPEREAIKARIIDERDYADIALDSNASEAAIRQRVSRGLSKLVRRRKRA